LIEIEVAAHRVAAGQGACSLPVWWKRKKWAAIRRTVRRKSMAKGSVENVLNSGSGLPGCKAV
jgi:hypothetical protein